MLVGRALPARKQPARLWLVDLHPPRLYAALLGEAAVRAPSRAIINPLLAVVALVAIAAYERWRAWRSRR